MRIVAEYVMRGRNQALWVSVLGASTLMFSWLSAAVLALVTLRRGPGEGAYILAWAALPAGFLLAMFGDVVPLGMIVGTTAMAAILRWTASWQLTLCASSVFGVVIALAMMGFGVNSLQEIASVFAEIIASWQSQLDAQGREVALKAPGLVTIAGMLGLVNAVSCILCLLLARWWQALLYNPGGFRAEFHGLRFTPTASVTLVALILGISTLGIEYRPWAVLFALPLCIAGLGFVHARAAHRGQGSGYLALFYLLWILLDPVKLIVMGIAVADSWIDFRSRWQKGPRPPAAGGGENQNSENE
jgi:hypothetical protein